MVLWRGAVDGVWVVRVLLAASAPGSLAARKW